MVARRRVLPTCETIATLTFANVIIAAVIVVGAVVGRPRLDDWLLPGQSRHRRSVHGQPRRSGDLEVLGL